MADSMIEKREHPRFAVALNCIIFDGERKLTGRTENLSRGGVSLMLPEAIEISTVVICEMALDFGDDGISEPLTVHATIVWCTLLGDAWQIGAKFSGMTREQRTYLEMFLHYLDSGREEKEPRQPTPRRRRP